MVQVGPRGFAGGSQGRGRRVLCGDVPPDLLRSPWEAAPALGGRHKYSDPGCTLLPAM